MSCNEIINVFIVLLGMFLGGHMLLYIFSPTYYFSEAPNKLLVKTIGDIFISIILKSISLVFISVLAVAIFPALNTLVVLLNKYFELELNLGFYEGVTFIVLVSITISVLLLLLEERETLKNGQLILFKGDLELDIPQAQKVEINKRLKGIKLLLSNGESMVAYTYGGFLMSPRIVMSKFMFEPGWSGQLAAVLLHELNHIERKDTFWLLTIYSYERLFKTALRVIYWPFKLLDSIPVVNLISKLMGVITTNVLELWNIFVGIGNLVSVKAEEYADTESYQRLPSEYLVEALYDVHRGHLGHYKYKSDEEIVQSIMRSEEDNFINGVYDEALTFKKILDLLKQTHPPLWKRVFMSAKYSERQSLNTYKDKYLIQWMIVILLFIAPVSWLSYLEYKKSENYQFNNKEVLKYIKYLEEGLE